jgi:uncharacterized membrane protein YukC
MREYSFVSRGGAFDALTRAIDNYSPEARRTAKEKARRREKEKAEKEKAEKEKAENDETEKTTAWRNG